MAKFCTKCGKELIDNKPCNCKNNLKKERETINASYDINNVIDIFKNIIKKPIDTVKELIKKDNLDLSIILIGINAIILSIIFVAGVNEVLYINYNMMPINISYFRCFMIAVALVIIIHLLLAGINYLILRIYNTNIEYKKLLNLSAIVSLPITLAGLINILLIFISLPIAILLFVISTIVSFISLYEGMKEITSLDNNKVTYITSISLVSTILVFSILFLEILF